MKPNIFGSQLSLLLITALAASAATEERLNKRFAVQPGGAVVVEVEFGSVNVSTNATSEVVVDVWRKVGRRSTANEEAFLRDHPVTFTQDGNTVTIQSHGDSRSPRSWFGRNSNEARYTISVPARFSARLRTGGGAVDVAGLTGEVKGDTGGGSVKLGACDGALSLRTGGGSIEANASSGTLDATTGGGSVTVREFQGPARVHTGGGGLTLEKVQGALEGSTGGGSISAVLTSELSGPVKLSTGGGGITVNVPATVAFNLDARTGGGGVSTEFPVAVVGKIQPSHLEGPVNGGGKKVELRTGGGGIHLKKL